MFQIEHVDRYRIQIIWILQYNLLHLSHTIFVWCSFLLIRSPLALLALETIGHATPELGRSPFLFHSFSFSPYHSSITLLCGINVSLLSLTFCHFSFSLFHLDHSSNALLTSYINAFSLTFCHFISPQDHSSIEWTKIKSFSLMGSQLFLFLMCVYAILKIRS